MDDRITALLREARVTSERQDAYGLLPDVISVLEQIQAYLEVPLPDKHLVTRGAGALGRIVTDDYAFSESLLGQSLLDLINDIAIEFGQRDVAANHQGGY